MMSTSEMAQHKLLVGEFALLLLLLGGAALVKARRIETQMEAERTRSTGKKQGEGGGGLGRSGRGRGGHSSTTLTAGMRFCGLRLLGIEDLINRVDRG